MIYNRNILIISTLLAKCVHQMTFGFGQLVGSPQLHEDFIRNTSQAVLQVSSNLLSSDNSNSWNSLNSKVRFEPPWPSIRLQISTKLLPFIFSLMLSLYRVFVADDGTTIRMQLLDILNIIKLDSRMSSILSVLHSVENMAKLNTANLRTPETVTSENIEMETFFPESSDQSVTYVGSLSENKVSIMYLMEAEEFFENDVSSGAGFSFKNMPDLLDFKRKSVRVSNNTEINSNWVGFSFFKTMEFNESQVIIELKHKKTGGKNPQCVFWNTSSSHWTSGFWDNRGCELLLSNDTSTICACNHLTNFAVLMDFNHVVKTLSSNSEACSLTCRGVIILEELVKLVKLSWLMVHEHTVQYHMLSILSEIFLPISITCLLITVLLFVLIRSLRSRKNVITVNLCVCLAIGQILIFFDAKLRDTRWLSVLNLSNISIMIAFHSIFRSLRSRKNVITVNLCICLAIGQILIFFDAKLKPGNIECTIVAMILEYFLLSAFSWFLLEGYYLYKMVVKVFNTKNQKLIFYYLFGYGIPVLIISVSYGIFPGGYQDGENRCWLTSEKGFIWSFISPIATVIAVKGGTVVILQIKSSKLTIISLGKVDFSAYQDFSMIKATSSSAAGREIFFPYDFIKIKSSGANLTASNHVNVILFVLALKASLAVKQNLDRQLQIRRRIKGAITLMFLLGITWIFGLFFFNKDSIFMAYIFVILNASQKNLNIICFCTTQTCDTKNRTLLVVYFGIFIFIFQIVLNNLNRQAIIKALKKTLLKPQFSFVSTVTSSSMVKSDSTSMTKFYSSSNDGQKIPLTESRSTASSSST
ncbi:Adhesion G protein-coupled receptor L3 [Nymphon striatum]|nr:Adhesion G protein-coupled receptor L3 [Nymphon striatum]